LKLGERWSLRYAGADAQLIVDTLTKKAGPLHTEVISKLLVSDGDTPPTRANIENTLLAFREARAEDTVILFLASHGVNEGANYLMIPEDAERTAAGYWLPSSVVKWSVLQQALQEAQGSRIMFVDTCHSSEAYSPRLVKDAADANIIVFSATDKDTNAQETSKLGHGAFTYAFLRETCLDRMRASDFARAVVVEVVADYHGFLSGVTVLGLVGKAQFTGTSKLRSVAKRFRWTVGAFGNFPRSAWSRSVHPSWSRAVPCQCLGSVGCRRRIPRTCAEECAPSRLRPSL
jgi:hypothetical protein